MAEYCGLFGASSYLPSSWNSTRKPQALPREPQWEPPTGRVATWHAPRKQKDERSSCNTWPKQRNPIPRKSTTVQVKFTRQPFPESFNCLTTVSKNIHKFKLSSNYMDNISKTVDNKQNMLWSSAAGIFHLTHGHLDPITATSLDHKSTLVQNDQQQNREQNRASCRRVPMSPQMSN